LVLYAVFLVFVLQVWCCVAKHGLVTLVVIMILKDTATFQVLFIVSVFSAWDITTGKIASGWQWRSKVKFVKCLCLLPVVLVLLFWSWSLVLDLQAAVVVLVFDPWSKNLVLFTSLM